MKRSRVLVCLGIFSLGVATGWLVYQHVATIIQRETAQGNLYLAGESLRTRDLVGAMMHAQSAATQAPYAYSPYEAIGDVYVQFGLPSAARTMYTKAIEKLTTKGEGAMLVARVPPQSAIELVRRKLNSLPSADSSRPDVKDRS